MDGSRTPRKILEEIIYGSRTLGKPKEGLISVVTRDARKLLGIGGWKRLALDEKVLGRKCRWLGPEIWLLYCSDGDGGSYSICSSLSYRWHC